MVGSTGLTHQYPARPGVRKTPRIGDEAVLNQIPSWEQKHLLSFTPFGGRDAAPGRLSQSTAMCASHELAERNRLI